jgi:hypothetical protein
VRVVLLLLLLLLKGIIVLLVKQVHLQNDVAAVCLFVIRRWLVGEAREEGMFLQVHRAGVMRARQSNKNKIRCCSISDVSCRVYIICT